MVVRSPIDGMEIARLKADTRSAVAKEDRAAPTRRSAPGAWCRRRGAASSIRLFGEELRAHKAALGRLVSIETGKILQEGLGEVQEMIDICDFAVGLSRQLYGLTIASERPGHRMMETWHPLGVVGVISAFNFPVAVWSWNFALAIVVRRQRGVEAVGQDAADRARLRGDVRQGGEAASADAPEGSARSGVRRQGGGRGAGRRCARRLGQRHRLDPHGPRSRPARASSASAACCWSWAATTA